MIELSKEKKIEATLRGEVKYEYEQVGKGGMIGQQCQSTWRGVELGVGEIERWERCFLRYQTVRRKLRYDTGKRQSWRGDLVILDFGVPVPEDDCFPYQRGLLSSQKVHPATFLPGLCQRVILIELVS